MQQEAWEGYLIRVGEENSEGAGKSWELLGKKADEASHALEVGPKKASSVMEVAEQLRREDKGRGKAAENWKNLVSGQACLEFGLGSEEEPEGEGGFEGVLRTTAFREGFLQDAHILSLRG